MEKLSFVSACRKTFGPRTGQSLTEFAKEIKIAREADPDFWVREFAKIGIELDAASAVAA